VRTAVLVLAVSGGRPLPAVATPRAYVPSVYDGTVSVIDTAADTVTATVPAGVQPFWVAVLPDGSRAYAAPGFYLSNVLDHKLTVIDTATNTVVATVPLVGGSH